MSKPEGSLADQLGALGFKVKQLSKKAHNERGSKSDKRRGENAQRGPSVSDMEAAMAAKLGRSEKNDGRSRKSSKRVLTNVAVEYRKRPAPQYPDPAPSKRAAKTGREHLAGNLTSAARERLHYDPSSLLEPGPPEAPAQFSQENEARSDISDHSQLPIGGIPGTGETEPSEAFARIVKLVGASTPAIEVRPKSIDHGMASQIDAAIQRGAASLRSNPEPDLDHGYVVGFDFGTSALKVVFRNPYVAGNPVAAMPAPDVLRSQGHPYLWQTVIWFDRESDCFSLYPKPGAVAIEGFKTGMVADRGGDAISNDPSVSRAEAATAFIALHMCNLIGWFNDEQPLTLCKASNFLAINFGVPVATQDDPKVLQPYKAIVSAAVELATSDQALRLSHVKTALASNQSTELPPGFQLIPELSAALVGYASDPTSPRGAHVLIDVGASTLDIVAFNLIDTDDEPDIKAFAASVDLLGAAALEVSRSNQISDDHFLLACRFQFGELYRYCCQERVADVCFSQAHRSKPVQLVITGGGCATSVHSDLIAILPKDRLGELDVARPAPPSEISAIDCDRSRLLVAFGLAHDTPDVPQLTLPSKIPDKQLAVTVAPTYVGAEQM